MRKKAELRCEPRRTEPGAGTCDHSAGCLRGSKPPPPSASSFSAASEARMHFQALSAWLKLRPSQTAPNRVTTERRVHWQCAPRPRKSEIQWPRGS